MTAATRQPGYYWVKEREQGCAWQIAHWNPHATLVMPGWWIAGRISGEYSDESFAEIDERQLKRPE